MTACAVNRTVRSSGLESREGESNDDMGVSYDGNLNSSYMAIGGSSDQDDHRADSPSWSTCRGSPLEEKLRKRVAFFFMDPIQKFIARRQAPWKLLLQFAKIIFITMQLLVFGQFRYAHTNYYKDNHIAFEHLFLKDWDSVREINAYPPSTGKFALYKKNSFYSYFNYTASTFADLDDLTIVPTLRNSTLDFCIEAYGSGNGHVDFEDIFLELDFYHDQPMSRCISIANDSLANFNSREYLKSHDFEVPWDTLLRMHINFTVNTVTSRQLGPMLGPECFNFRIDIVFDNRDHDGQIPIEMKTTPKRVQCPRLTKSSKLTIQAVAIHMLSVFVIAICTCSLVLCLRALLRGQELARDTEAFFKDRLNIVLSRREMCQFVNFWYIMICVNDILIIIGSVLKEMIETRRTNSDLWDFCSVFLGVGNLLVWLGMLRYLGFFDTYNTIILTLKEAMPNVVRFTICVGIMYIGFVFCGWVVLGPYQFKFYSISSTSECLFSLINGDDMFATFNMVASNNMMIWGFSRVYLYFFVVMFIYVVLSLFIAIIMDSYEIIKDRYKLGFPRTRVDEFHMAVKYDTYSNLFCEGIRPSLLYRVWSWVMIKRYGEQWKGYRRERGRYEEASGDEQAPLLT